MSRAVAALTAALMLLGLAGCMTAGQHQQAVQDNTKDRITVGKVQREIKVGMSSAQVIEVLGSPNVVSSDEQRREVWVYDKIATQHVYSTSSGGVQALILGGTASGGAAIGGGGGAGFQQGTGAVSTSQRTLTIVIKFDKGNRVRDFAYRQSSF